MGTPMDKIMAEIKQARKVIEDLETFADMMLGINETDLSFIKDLQEYDEEEKQDEN